MVSHGFIWKIQFWKFLKWRTCICIYVYILYIYIYLLWCIYWLMYNLVDVFAIFFLVHPLFYLHMGHEKPQTWIILMRSWSWQRWVHWTQVVSFFAHIVWTSFFGLLDCSKFIECFMFKDPALMCFCGVHPWFIPRTFVLDVYIPTCPLTSTHAVQSLVITIVVLW